LAAGARVIAAAFEVCKHGERGLPDADHTFFERGVPASYETWRQGHFGLLGNSRAITGASPSRGDLKEPASAPPRNRMANGGARIASQQSRAQNISIGRADRRKDSGSLIALTSSAALNSGNSNQNAPC